MGRRRMKERGVDDWTGGGRGLKVTIPKGKGGGSV